MLNPEFEPQYNDLAERSTLGSMLLSPQAVRDVQTVVDTLDFYAPQHRLIFAAITDMSARGLAVDAVTVAAELDRTGDLNRVGGMPYLHDLLVATPTAVGALSYARIVAEKARLRGLAELGVQLQMLASTPVEGGEVDVLLARAETFFRQQHRETFSVLAFDDLVQAWRNDLGSPGAAIPTPWSELNQVLNGGAYRGKMVTVGGRPGSGKSLLGLNIAAHAATLGFRSVVFSIEMGRVEVASRLLAAGGHAQFSQLVRRSLDLETSRKVEQFISESKGMALSVIDQESITVEQIVSECRAVKPDVVFVDYLQLVRATDSRVSREQQVAHMSRQLKIMSRELNAAVFVGAQLNRGPVDGGRDGVAGKPARLPVISDLRESGAIEQDSDVVLLLHRDPVEESIVKVVVGKNRNGTRGVVDLPFRGDQARIG